MHALTNTGAKIIEIETVQELEKAINEKTAMMWFLNSNAPLGKIQHEEWVAIAKKHKIPTMIDMAADVPPVSNLWKYNDLGFDLVCVSGGKAMCGPQSAGILMGRKDLIAAARLSAPPRGGNIGRGMKVNAIDPTQVFDFSNDRLLADSLLITPESFAYLKEARKIRYHQIRRGDTLGHISYRYGVSINNICRLNGITRKTILRVGNRLRLT